MARFIIKEAWISTDDGSKLTKLKQMDENDIGNCPPVDESEISGGYGDPIKFKSKYETLIDDLFGSGK